MDLSLRSALTWLALALAAPRAPAAVSSKAPTPARVSRRALEPQDALPAELRTFIQLRMKGHAEAMVDLLMAVTLLRTDLARTAAQRIASEPRLARPSAGDAEALSTANAQLSDRFFRLQDELRVRARSVADAAAAREPERVAARFGELASTCVECHAAYLQPTRATPEK